MKKNKEEISRNHKIYYENNKEKILNNDREKYKLNKDKKLRHQKEHNNRLCYDPIKRDYCSFCALSSRIQRNKELYKSVILSKCLLNT